MQYFASQRLFNMTDLILLNLVRTGVMSQINENSFFLIINNSSASPNFSSYNW